MNFRSLKISLIIAFSRDETSYMYRVTEEKSAISLTYREAEAGVMKSGTRDQREDSEDDT